MNKKKTPPLTASVITLGCKVNQCESEALQAGLAKTGWGCADGDKNADLYVINTCTVTQKAAMQSRQAIRKAIRKNRQAIIVATGCYAQSEADAIAGIQGIDYIVGNTDKHRIPDMVEYGKKPGTVSPIVIKNDMRDRTRFDKTPLPLAGRRTRPFIKIQDGCDQFCSYCIIPYTRGPSRSLEPDDVIAQVRYHAEQNAHEIVLTGIHLGRYGMDLSPATGLIDLLIRIHQENLIHRVRISSIEPMELTDEIINFTADSGRICPHFHIPLQSGDSSVLKRMRRPYDPGMFKRLVEKIHTALPDAAIGIDILVGFPGETDSAFTRTCDLIEKLPITYLHIFPFSPRPPAAASRYSNPVPADVIKARRNRLFRLGQAKKTTFYQKMIGRTLEVIIENRRDSATGLLKGISENYVKVLAEGNDGDENQIVFCRIEKILTPNTTFGKILR